jgi:hypothetical protein
MQSKELQELTASEKLTLEEEYMVQREPLPPFGDSTWSSMEWYAVDVNRELAVRQGQYRHLILFSFAELSFTVLARPPDPSSGTGLELTNEEIRALPMIGDINLLYLFTKNPREDPEIAVEYEVTIPGSW